MATVATATTKAVTYPTGAIFTNTNHTSGIYADKSVDGPEIGTLVVVVDRAKNLPNLRTMGKQDPYCAGRLGKEAKKTEPDRRGGQTPRWDQELRFTVRDSPDYHKIKVSVFNDDKRKTDLIGETWISLEDLLRPGGGQGDSWHTLNVKGRYAGEIRIELTFYDSRPKLEKPRDRKHSNASSTQSEQRPAMLGPRQPGGRRSLPATPPNAPSPSALPSEQSDAMPIPPTGLRSYHTPPRQPVSQQDSSPYIGPEEEQRVFTTGGNFSRRPLPTPGMSQSNTPSHTPPAGMANFVEPAGSALPISEFDESQDDYMPFVDDPYALQAIEAKQQEIQRQPLATPPRHDRVQVLSGSPAPRPLPPIELEHTQSAPELSSYERSSFASEYGPETPPSYGYNSPYGAPSGSSDYDSPLGRSWSSPSQKLEESFEAYDDSPPPPPPVHRNSAPSTTQALPRLPTTQQTNTPSRALHVSTNAEDFQPHFDRSASEPPQMQSYDSQMHTGRPAYLPETTTREQNTFDDYLAHCGRQSNRVPQHLSRLSDPSIRPRNELAHDPRYQNSHGRYGSNASQVQIRPLNYQSPPSYDHPQRGRPLSYQEDNRQPNRGSPMEAKAQQMNTPPGAPSQPPPQQQYQTPRKSISPRPSTEHSQTSTPYSPDSFDSLNPAHTSLPSQSAGNKFEPKPMYSSPNTSPERNSPQQPHPSSPLEQQQMVPEPTPPQNGPIIGSDGRVKDPSDHLPLSSYAPEPERKANRPSTVVNIKSRFGPRDSPLVSGNSSPVSPNGNNSPTDSRGGNTLKRSPGGTVPSPLGPTHSSLLNTNMNMNSGFNMSSPYPPPVPGKRPMSGYMAQVDEHNHFEMAALSLEQDDGYEQAEPGGPKLSAAGRAILNKGRVRKSRWGA